MIDALCSDYAKTMQDYWASLLQGVPQAAQRSRQAQMVQGTLDFDPLPALAAYRGPQLLIDTGRSGGPALLHDQAPQIERRIVGPGGHWPHIDNARAFGAVLDDFIGRVD